MTRRFGASPPSKFGGGVTVTSFIVGPDYSPEPPAVGRTAEAVEGHRSIHNAPESGHS